MAGDLKMATTVYVYPDRKFFDDLLRIKDKSGLPEKFIKMLKDYKKCKKYEKSVEMFKIDVKELKDLYKVLQDLSPKTYLHELLQGSTIKLPEKEIPPRDPELEKRVQRLKREQEERDYKKMVQEVDPRYGNKDCKEESLSHDMQVLRANLITVFNFVLTVGGTFFFGYKMVEYSLPSPVVAAQVLVGIILASIVAVADLYFIIKYLPD